MHALTPNAARLTYVAASAVSAIYALLAQLLPSVVGEGIRAWTLTRFGCGWRAALTSVTIDRAVGVAAPVAFAFVILLLPSALTALSGYRDLTLFAFGPALFVGALGLFFTPRLAPCCSGGGIPTGSVRLRLMRIAFCLGHVLRPCSAPRLPYPFADHRRHLAGWARSRSGASGVRLRRSVHGHVRRRARSDFGRRLGPRELAVVSLLGAHGLAPERALIFSVCFGLVAVVGVLPGLIVWLLYPLPRVTAGQAGRRKLRPLTAATVRSVAAAGADRGVPFTSITNPRPPLSRRLISGQPAAR